MKWLEVSLTVDGEMAEAVAEVLSRYVPDGVVMESTAISPELEGEGHPIGPLRVSGYLPQDAQLEEKRQQIERALYFLGRIHPLPEAQFTPIAEADWSESWKENFRPVAIGERLVIVPSWLEPPDHNRIPIRLDPGMAFGTGTHPTTQLCLEILETRFLGENGFLDLDVLDIGCGSGILSIAALKLGASRAFGVDSDPDSITIAEENAAINDVAEQASFSSGSVAAVQEGVFPVQKAPMVVANILAHILIELLDSGLGDLVAPQGELILSGILEEQLAEMQSAVQQHGCHIVEKRQIKDWVALRVKTE